MCVRIYFKHEFSYGKNSYGKLNPSKSKDQICVRMSYEFVTCNRDLQYLYIVICNSKVGKLFRKLKSFCGF